MIPRLALRGAIKHWKRSVVVVGALAVACAVMIAVGSLLGGITSSFYEAVIPASGHVRIDDARSATALNPLGLETLIPDAAGLSDRITALGDLRIKDVEPVLSFGALLVEDRADGDPRNLAMRGIALRPDSRFADNVRDALTGGSFLPEGRGILISDRAARLVGTGLGGGVLVLVQDKSGQPWYERLEVTGTFSTESRDFDESTFYLGDAKAAEMLDVAGAAREVRILLSDRGQAEPVAAELREALGGQGGTGDLRIEAWQTINASVTAILLFVKILLGIIMGLFAVVAGTIIANTSLMSVMERLREFGTMRAMGLRARSMRRLILVEGLILAGLGALVGIALGSVVVALLSQGGLDLGGLMESLGLRRYNRPKVDLWWYAGCAAASLLVSLVATDKAARTVRALGVAESLAAAG
jgi:putative ABC transport system permease protein